MKRLLFVVLCLFCLCGCHDTLGSFEEGTLDSRELIRRINEEADDHDWNLMMLKENEDVERAQQYGIAEGDVVSCSIYTSVIDAIPDEIAVFEVTDEKRALVKEKAAAYIESRKEDAGLLTAYKDVLGSYKEIERGNYYIIVIGNDADKVVRFIEEIA